MKMKPNGRKPRILCLLVAACLLLVLTACSDAGDSSTVGNTPSHAETPTLASQGEGESASRIGGYTAETPLVIRMATMDNRTDNELTNGNGIIFGDKFKEYIEEALGDCVQVIFYTDGTMGNDGEIFESLCAGTLEMSDTLSSTLSNYDPSFKLLDLPYLFEGDWPHVLAFIESDVASALAAGLHENVDAAMCLGIKANGPRNISNNTRAVISAADVKGLNLRVQSADIYTQTFQAFGAVPVPMSGSELFTALQQGTVDGEENSPITDYSIGLSGLTTYYTETRHIQMFSTMCCNAAWFEGLPSELQEIVADCVLRACVECSGMMQEKCEICVDGIESDFENQVVRYADVDIDSFRSAAEAVYGDFRATYGGDQINAIRGLTY